MAPGLIMMAMLNNAFANSSSSLIQAKIMGTSPDFLTPPLTPLELVIGFALGAATRGVLVGLVTAAAVWPFAHYTLAQPWAVAYFGLGGLPDDGPGGRGGGPVVGEVRPHGGGDQLRGHADDLPVGHLLSGRPPARAVPQRDRSYNPFFYMIAGFRYGFIGGRPEGSLVVGAVFVGLLVVVLALVCWRLFRSG